MNRNLIKIMLSIIILSCSYFAHAQDCNEVIPAGAISATVNGATVTFNNIASASGTHPVEYMFIVYDGGGIQYINTGTDPTLVYTYTTGGIQQEATRCVRYIACGGAWQNETPYIFYDVFPPCYPLSDPGVITGDETVCASSYDPGIINNYILPSPINPQVTFYWETSTDGVNFTPDWNATYEFYDPPTITQTTYYRRMARNVNCISFIPSNVVVKTIQPMGAPTINTTQPVCNENLGSISVASPIGASYTYSKDGVNFQTSTDFTSLPPGQYPIVVKNTANGCVSNAINILLNSAIGAPSAPVVATTLSGCIQPTGSIEVTSPLTAGNTFSVDGVNYQSSPLFSNLAVGTYTVRAKSDLGCKSIPTVASIGSSAIAPTLSVVQPTCTNALGSITVSNPIGSGYLYSLDGINYQSNPIFDMLSIGVYTVYAKDPTTECAATSIASINSYSGAPAPPIISVIQPTCANPTGTITVTSPIGSFFYTYKLDGGAVQNSTTFAGVAPGVHTVTLYSLFSTCVSSAVAIINSINVTPTISGGTTTCVGNTISLTGSPAGGSWSSSDPLVADVNASTGVVTGVNSGAATITYTFNNGCGAFTSTANVSINPLPNAPSCAIVYSCPGADATNEVLAAVSPAGGSVTWNTGDPTTATTYTYSVSNSCGNSSCTNSIIRTSASVGNYVWLDLNRNGLNDEPSSAGINGVSVELWNVTSNTWVATTATANDGLGNPGYYNFDICISGNYKIKFPLQSGLNTLTTATTTSATDNNSDADLVTGESPVFALDVNGSGTDKNNLTIDAGYKEPLKACLGNYVFNDLNHDGIQNNGEVGVANVTTTLYNATTNAILATTVTDAYGFYLFCSLNPGDYKVGFSLPTNYVFTYNNTGGNDELDSDPNQMTGMTGTYTLVSGDSNMTVDAGIFQPQPITAEVGDRVWFDANGDGIQDLNEKGVSGITISLYACSNLGVPIRTTITDANGNYLFENVLPGSYAIGITLPVGVVLTQQNGAVSETLNSDVNPQTERSSCFTVNAGDHLLYADAGIVLKSSGSVSIGDRVWRDSNHDGVQDGTETGISNITVTLYGPDGTTVIGSTITDALGNYSFSGYPAGCYVIGFSNLPANFVFSPANIGSDTSKNSDADVNTGKTNVICLTNGQNNPTIDAGIYDSQLLTPNNNSIGNKVWYDENHDGIQDANEYGYPGVVVTLYDCATNSVVATTTTSSNGSYLFDGIGNGTYFVGFGFVPGYQFTTANSDVAGIFGENNSDANPSTGMTTCISLIGGTNITAVDAGLYPGSNRNATSTLGDMVWVDMNSNGLQEAGEPGVSGVTVTLFASDGTTELATTITDGLGNYIFTNLLGGNFIVGFSNLPINYTFTSSTGSIDDENNSDADINTGKTNVVSLGLGEDKMSVDAGLIAPQSTVCLGDYVWVDLNHDGVQDGNEPAVPGVTVKLYDNNTNTILQVATTNSLGRYMFCGLTNGNSYSVGFENLPQGYIFTSSLGVLSATDNSDADPLTGRTSTVTLGAVNDLTLDAGIYSPSTAIVGNYVWYDEDADGLQDASESAIAGVLVTLYDNADVPVASTVTDANGGYLFTNVLPGNYTIGFEGYATTLIPTTKGGNANADDDSNIDPSTGKTDLFTVVAGGSNLTLDAGFKANPIAGLGNYVWIDANENGLQDANEQSMSGVIVTLYQADGVSPIAMAITDGNGAYSFPNLTIGSYVVGFSNIADGFTRTIQLGGINDASNSDIGVGNKTPMVTLVAGEYNPNVDAGFYQGFPLPVELSAFEAIGQDCYVTLNWTTSSEKNASFFDVMRTDLKTSIKENIARIDAKGNSQIESHYKFVDRNVYSGSYLYQLNVVDLDAKSGLSEAQTVQLNCSEVKEKVNVYPNPTSGNLSVQIYSDAEDTYNINIHDALGRLVLHTETDVNNSMKIVNLDVQFLSPGTYSVEVAGFYQRQNFKIIVSK